MGKVTSQESMSGPNPEVSTDLECIHRWETSIKTRLSLSFHCSVAERLTVTEEAHLYRTQCRIQDFKDPQSQEWKCQPTKSLKRSPYY
ncbi:hypothetical protein Y1Q_0005680 [Alligator mississippiensis]|uniref:Uncharacterized protein n=1 Tax=Alligator mississippiensis TaxID=8496 RepID=A0A151MFI2_ALLMI|nr:hypothetical protein Y1Q_0005680 [Alligator mississippiensis]